MRDNMKALWETSSEKATKYEPRFEMLVKHLPGELIEKWSEAAA